jgi:hypothetical protein
MVGMILHVVAIYVGTQVAQLEYPDVWRCIVVALVSYVVMFVLGLLLLPLALIPFAGALVSAVVLGVGTACAAKMVLSCDWQPAWTIGATAAVINFLAGFLLSGCTA